MPATESGLFYWLTDCWLLITWIPHPERELSTRQRHSLTSELNQPPPLVTTTSVDAIPVASAGFGAERSVCPPFRARRGEAGSIPAGAGLTAPAIATT